MQNMNSGYSGWSMSNRAAQAYSEGQMPKSKWTKKAMLEAVKSYCFETGLLYDASIERLKKAELFDQCFEKQSWHHTSIYCNETDFYGVNEDAMTELFRPMTEAEKQQAVAEQQAIKDQQARRDEMRVAYREEHGFSPRSVLAYELAHPEMCSRRKSRTGNIIISATRNGKTRECHLSQAGLVTIDGFDAINER